MVIVETAVFTRRIQAILSDEQYRLLQNQLVANPKVGRVIPGSGGLRCLWSIAGEISVKFPIILIFSLKFGLWGFKRVFTRKE
jgi:hypothetical protein